MIKVTRLTKPPILVKQAEQWTIELCKGNKKVQTKYQHKEIKDTLVKMFHGKCAYCESKITHVDYGHIEHYRPKSKFPQLTFEWSNLLLACGMCNGTKYKGEHFPESQEGGPLVNPCKYMPTKHFTFDYDPTTQMASVYGSTVRGETTEKLLGLNRDELRRHRSKRVRQLYCLAKLAKTDKEARALLKEAIQADAEYAAFARMIYQSESLET